MRPRLFVAGLGALFLWTLYLHTYAKPEPVVIQGRTVAIWLPAKPAGAPVIIFSHGFHGCATQSVFLMEAFARAGYAVFAPNHQDASCYRGGSSLFSFPDVRFDYPLYWKNTTYEDRKADIAMLLDVLPADPRYANLDWSRVGLVGHSLGGYTVLGMAGANARWYDGRIKAVLALSPYVAPYFNQLTFSAIHVPVMYQGGTRDFAVTPDVRKTHGAYNLTPAPKYFVNFDGAGHFDWTDLFVGFHAGISRYGIAFFDKTLKGNPFPEELLRSPKNLAELRFQPDK